MWLIIAFIAIGVLLLVAELVLLPGLSVAGVAAFISYSVALYLVFKGYGSTAGLITICVIIALSVAASIMSLKAKTWQRFSLKNNIDGTSQQQPQMTGINIGERAIAVTRLAPMGKISINGKSVEAKSPDSYIDPGTEVEVTGFENFSVIVKQIK